jgi:hypothetical protein
MKKIAVAMVILLINFPLTGMKRSHQDGDTHQSQKRITTEQKAIITEEQERAVIAWRLQNMMNQRPAVPPVERDNLITAVRRNYYWIKHQGQTCVADWMMGR